MQQYYIYFICSFFILPDTFVFFIAGFFHVSQDSSGKGKQFLISPYHLHLLRKHNITHNYTFLFVRLLFLMNTNHL